MVIDSGGELDARRIKEERELAEAVDSLEKTLARFREAFKSLRGERENLSSSVRKISSLKKETVGALKNLVKTTDALKRETEKSKEELRRVAYEELAVSEKYKDMLSGRIPKELAAENVEDLSEQRERFMKNMQTVFDDMDRKLTAVRERKEALRAKLESDKKKIKNNERRRVILFRKLKIYKNEMVERERELVRILERERALLREYSGYAMSLKKIFSLNVEVEETLSSVEDELIKSSAKNSGAWPFHENITRLSRRDTA